jgi:hypothetical protein
VTNGASILPSVDGRTALGRRYRDVVEALTSDQGGASQLSEARLQLIRRFAACACLAEELESRLVRGEPVNLAEHASLCSSLVRLGSRIGVNRVAKPVESLSQYLARLEPEPEQAVP